MFDRRYFGKAVLQANRHKQIASTLTLCLLTATVLLPVKQPTWAQTIPDAQLGTNSNYLLGPGDQIEITVFDYDEFTGRKVVLPDGTISLPLIGIVTVANRTPAQIAQDLTNRLSVWLKDPSVSVDLIKLRPVRINVAGEVQRPGPIQLNNLPDITAIGNDASELPTVSGALLKAGGITKDADIRAIELRRAGNAEPIEINLLEAIATERATLDLLLRDGDSIFVPKLDPDETIDRRLIARSSVAPDTVRVRVVGEVKVPGEKAVPPGSSISSAIAIAGGPTNDAKLSQVSFIRLQEDGRVQEQTLDLSTLTDTLQVEEGDVIVIPRTVTSRNLDIGNRASGPASAVMQFLQLIKLFFFP